MPLPYNVLTRSEDEVVTGLPSITSGPIQTNTKTEGRAVHAMSSASPTANCVVKSRADDALTAARRTMHIVVD